MIISTASFITECVESQIKQSGEWLSNESRFRLQRADGRARAYSWQNVRFAAYCLQEADRVEGESQYWQLNSFLLIMIKISKSQS